MGVVFRARQAGLGRTIALKVIAPPFTGDETYRALFKREAQLSASLRHPHVIDVYDFGEVEGRLYLAMRYVDGADLKRILASTGRLPPDRAIEIITQTAEALDAAHRAGLVHRDIKPGNILVTERHGTDYVYLTDFGLTKQQGVAIRVLTQGIVGTAAYMAPEQVNGDVVDKRADVYSLGCVLYELLTGVVPYPRDGVLAQLYAHVYADPPHALDLAPNLPAALDEVIRTALAKDAGDRYPTAGQLGRAARAIARVAPDESSGAALREDAPLVRWAGPDAARDSHKVDRLLPIGSEFAGYVINGVAGIGAMGEVYRATHRDLDRVVALKLVKPDYGQDETFRRRFQREARVTALIDHPNLVTVYAVGELDGRQYIAMRYVDGPALDELLRREGPLEPGRAVKIIAQVAAALDAAHSHGIVHRDPKCGNLLVESHRDGDEAYLSDFGLSKDVTGSLLTLPGQALGSFDYMAPEMIRGEPVSGASDTYLLGCTLYELLTGFPPFAEAQGMRVLWAHLQDEPRSIKSMAPWLPDSLDQVVRRALAKDPEARFESSGSMAYAAIAAVESQS